MSYSSTILGTSGLQSYWRLGETGGSGTVADSAGSVTGTVSGATLGITSLLVGDANTAASFDGVNDGISMGNVYSFTGTATFSVEFLFRTPGTLPAAVQFIVSKTRNDTADGERQGWNVGMDENDHFFAQRWLSNAPETLVNTTTLAASTTYHVVYTFTGTTQQVYVNAGTAASGSSTASMIEAAVTPANFGIGAFDGAGFFFTNGTIDEVSIYNVVLDAATVLAHYNETITTTDQFARPASDSSVGTWTTDTGGTTNLYQAIDESSFSDADYIHSIADP